MMMRTLDLLQAQVHGNKRPTLFGSASLDHGYRPLRGLLFSLLVHGFLRFGMLFFPIHDRVSAQTRYLARAVIRHNKIVLYLPPLGGKPEDQVESQHVSKPHDKSTLVASAPKTKGFSYPRSEEHTSELQSHS